MKNITARSFILAPLLFCLIACSSQIKIDHPVTLLPKDEECIDSFDAFAFSTPDLFVPRQEFILPSEPWSGESILPDDLILWWSEVSIVRVLDGYTEVWVRNSPLGAEPTKFWVYRTDTREWKEVSAWVDQGEGAYADKLFVTPDGHIWGKNKWQFDEDVKINVPMLSRFNEIKQVFEFEPETSNREIFPSDWNYFSPVVNTPDGIFWIFEYRDAIYSYDPTAKIMQRHSSLSEFESILSVAPAPDDVFFFFATNRLMYYQVIEGQLFRFDAQKGEINPVTIPTDTWPSFQGLLVDHTGKLWLDSFGWMDEHGEWVKFHPQMKKLIALNKSATLYNYYIPPTALMESSDGRIWFVDRSFIDVPNYRSGLAWYNPATNEGCWSTTFGNNLIEDSQQVLWMFFKDTLYSRPLRP